MQKIYQWVLVFVLLMVGAVVASTIEILPALAADVDHVSPASEAKKVSPFLAKAITPGADAVSSESQLFIRAADVITAAGCTQGEVQTAIENAHPGDTVIVPAGAATWSSAVEITQPIIVFGADSGNTVLTASGELPHGFFYVHGFSSSLLVRISGFHFEMVNWTPYTAIYIDDLALDNLRIDRNIFNRGGHAIYIAGSKGVIDHNTFYNGNLTIEFSAGSDAQADASWASLVAGTSDALFIEDNSFVDNNDLADSRNERIGTHHGGKLVIRHNHWDSTAFTGNYQFVPIHTHGNATGGGATGYYGDFGARRGQSIVEIYNNSFAGYRIDSAMSLRGSSNLIFNNEITSNGGTDAVKFWEEESWTASAFTPVRTQWPAEDQVHNTFIWNNKLNNAVVTDSDVKLNNPALEATFIQQNRDYFMHAPENIGGKETFMGRNGAAGTYPTDGSVFPNTGTMVFTSTGRNAHYPYIPYDYPHHLTLVDYPGEQRTLDLQGRVGSDQAQLSWQAVTGAASYRVVRDWDKTGTVTTTNTLYQETWVGPEHVYMVYALDGAGEILAAEGVLVSPLNAFIYLPLISKEYSRISDTPPRMKSEQ